MFNKLFFPFFIVFFTFISCQQKETMEDMKPAPLPETWQIVMSFQDKAFNLTTTNVGDLVGNYDASTGKNPVVGRVLKFSKNNESFYCEVFYEFAVQKPTWAVGNLGDKTFLIDHMDTELPTIGFCGGAHDVPVVFKLVQIQ